LQTPHQKHDAAAAGARTEPTFVRFPRACVLGMSIGAFLHYCLFYHAHAPKGKLSCPHDVREVYKVRHLTTRIACGFGVHN
jgi:hypothetical protein